MSITSAASSALAASFLQNGFAANPLLVRSTKPEFGDLQCNDIMGLAKKAGHNPREMAAGIAAAVTHPDLADVSMAGPGFINVRLTNEAIGTEATAMLASPSLSVVSAAPLLTVIDFGGPNVAKSLHIGHLRSFVIGESLRRILSEIGHQVVSDIHLGDWGLQMGKLLLGIEIKHPGILDRPQAAAQLAFTIDELTLLYKEANSLCDSDPSALVQARQLTARLQDGDELLRSIWLMMRKVSLEAVAPTIVALGAHFDHFLGESDAHDEVAPMLEDLLARGLAYESDGALVMDVSGPRLLGNVPPLLLRKSDGAALYGTTDLATLRQRVRDLGAERIVYCTDSRQTQHIESVFSAARTSGYAASVELVHAAFGTVNGTDGKPFKTRDGNAVELADMLSATVAKAEEKLTERGNPETASVVGIGALKFADLQTLRASGYVFDLDKMTSFEGKTGPYLQYAFARIASMIDRAEDEGVRPAETITVSHPAERDLLVECLWYPQSVADAARTYEPAEIADRAFAVAQAFSRFYTECNVLQSDAPESRLATCLLVSRVIGRCLTLLGMEAVRKM